MDNTVILEKNGQKKTMSERSYQLLKGSLNGYRLVSKGKVYAEAAPEKELTREQMIEALKNKGINVHHKLGDAKLKERYGLEIKANK